MAKCYFNNKVGEPIRICVKGYDPEALFQLDLGTDQDRVVNDVVEGQRVFMVWTQHTEKLLHFRGININVNLEIVIHKDHLQLDPDRFIRPDV